MSFLCITDLYGEEWLVNVLHITKICENYIYLVPNNQEIRISEETYDKIIETFVEDMY